jgi:NitT/TauT family transport system ATP-binding protein
MTMTTPAVHIESLHIAFPSADGPVLADVSFEVGPAECLAILGASGSGKSSLLRCIAGTLAPSAGRVSLFGEAPQAATAAGDVGAVFQDSRLLPWLCVRDNVALPTRLGDRSEGADRGRTAWGLAAVGLSDSALLYPAQLSGGMQRRVALARALVLRPRILLLDEPFTGLDYVTRYRLLVLMADLIRELGIAVVLVTHAVDEAVFLADRLLVLAGRPATVRADRPVASPTERTERYLRSPAFDDAVRGARGEFMRLLES